MSEVGKSSFFIFFLTLLFGNAAVAACNNSNGLIACYSFSGNANNSSSIPSLNGTVSGPQLTTDRFGNPNSAYLFDGVDDFIEVPNTNNALSLTGPFTIAAWVKPAAAGIDRRTNPIIWKVKSVGSNRDNYLLSWANDSTFMVGLERSRDGRDFEALSTTQQFGDWYHVAGIYNGQTLQIYINGILEKSAQIGPVAPYTGPAPLRIGNNLNTNHSKAGVFQGVIDEVVIYDRPLPMVELLELAELPVTGHFPGISLFNPNLSVFYLKESLSSGNADHQIPFGSRNADLVPLLGDWNGDLTHTLGLYNPTRGVFYLKDTLAGGAADVTLRYGPANAGWISLSGDWDGNGVNTVGLYNPSRGIFYLKNGFVGGAADITFPYGPANADWIPLSGDWDGDGVDSVGLYNPSRGLFYLKNTLTGGAADMTFPYGPANAGWIPLSGDWDSDGVDSVGLYNPTLGLFYLRNTLTGGAADVVFRYGPANSDWIPLGWRWIKN